MKELQPGHVLDQRYRLIRVMSAGTFGTIWAAEHLALRSVVAVKVLEQFVVGGEDMRQRFSREARAAAALRSPHVVQILDYGVAGDTPYIVMELLEGESLEQRLERAGRLDVIQTERVVRHVARAIDRAHEAGIVHRDLKPSNIFIQLNDGDEIVKVLDFGIAKTNNVAFDRSLVGVTPAGILLGTPHYMSPEQIQGNQDLDGRSDLWALAVVAYECLVGVPPFGGDNITAVLTAICSDARPIPSERAPVPAGFDAWFARACAPRPRDRFESARQTAEEFARLCCVPVSTSRVSALFGPSRSVASVRSSRVNGLRTGMVLLFLIGGVTLWRFSMARFDTNVEETPDIPGGVRASLPLTPQPLPRAPAQPSAAPPRSNQELGQEPPSAPSSTGFEPGQAPADAASEAASSPSPPLEPASAVPSPARVHARPRLTPGLERRKDRPVIGCDTPWDFDEQGRPRARPDCL